MTLTIGRVALLDDLFSVSFDGEELDVDGSLDGSDPGLVLADRQRLTGVVGNPWEPFVPVVWDVDPFISGYYTVESLRVSTVPASYTAGHFPFTARLRRVSLGALDATLRGNVRYNLGAGLTQVSAAESTPWHAVPGSVDGYSDTSTRYTRTGPNGTVEFRVPAAQAFYDARVAYSLDPADYYSMSARVELDNEIVVGGNVGQFAANWRVGNGLVEMSLGSTGLLSFRAPRGASPNLWDGSTEFRLGYYSGGTFVELDATNVIAVEPLVNGPEYVAVRLVVKYAPSGSTTARATVDVGLRRGSYVVDVSVSGDSRQWAIGSDASTVCDVLDAGSGTDPVGIRRQANDGFANRWFVLTSLPYTAVLATGYLYALVASTSRDFAIGVEPGGTGAVSPNTGAELANQWFAPILETTTARRL
jgi:hypothetical protein